MDMEDLYQIRKIETFFARSLQSCLHMRRNFDFFGIGSLARYTKFRLLMNSSVIPIC